MFTIKRRARPRWIGERSVEGTVEQLDGAWLAIDTETTGLDHRGERGVDRQVEPARAFMATFCDPEGRTCWARWRVDAHTRKVEAPDWSSWGFDRLKATLEDEGTPKVFFNAPFDLRHLGLVGAKVKGEIIDASLAAHVVRPDLYDYRLKPLCERMLGIDVEDSSVLDKNVQSFRLHVGLARKRIAAGKAKPGDAELAMVAINPSEEDQAYKADFWLADALLCSTYGAKDAYRTAALWQACKEAMDLDAAEEDGVLWRTFRMEQELQRHILRMEDRGIGVDPSKVDELVKFYRGLEEKAREAIVEEVGEDFNPRSNPQMQEEFFVKRGHLPIKYVTKKRQKVPNPCPRCKGREPKVLACKMCQGNGFNPQCNGDFLAKIGVKRELGDGGEEVLLPNDALAFHLLRAKAAKAMGDFALKYRHYMVREPEGWALHPNYKQCEAITLRLSCEKPNLQNVADDDSGKKRIDVPYRPRECFVPRSGCTLLAPDYSQIEVWLLMLRSGDETLRETLLAGGDTHGRIASKLWGKDFNLDEALADKKRPVRSLSKAAYANLKNYTNRRKRSKNIQFCKIYGGGATKIGEMIGCSTEEAKRFIADWEELFHDVAGWMSQKIHTAKRHGWSENIYGYRYPVERDFAYCAVNYDVQGSAAFLLKRAMIKVGELAERRLDHLWPLLTVHDELILETSLPRETKAMRDLQLEVVAAMQADWRMLKCPVPFPVGMKVITTNWAEAKEVAL